MTTIRRILIDATEYEIVISDEKEALLAAKAAGRAVVGLLTHENREEWLPAAYLVENIEEVEPGYWERVMRRHLGLPWQIAQSETLLIREFSLADTCQIPTDVEDFLSDQIFYQEDSLRAYIDHQYGFYEYGLWAVVRKSDGAILGKAGLMVGENPGTLDLGYHIFPRYRGQGYAKEACRLILTVADTWWKLPVWAAVNQGNEISKKLLESLGFDLMEQRRSEAGQWQCRYARSC